MQIVPAIWPAFTLSGDDGAPVAQITREGLRALAQTLSDPAQVQALALEFTVALTIHDALTAQHASRDAAPHTAIPFHQ